MLKAIRNFVVFYVLLGKIVKNAHLCAEHPGMYGRVMHIIEQSKLDDHAQAILQNELYDAMWSAY